MKSRTTRIAAKKHSAAMAVPFSVRCVDVVVDTGSPVRVAATPLAVDDEADEGEGLLNQPAPHRIRTRRARGARRRRLRAGTCGSGG